MTGVCVVLFFQLEHQNGLRWPCETNKNLNHGWAPRTGQTSSRGVLHLPWLAAGRDLLPEIVLMYFLLQRVCVGGDSDVRTAGSCRSARSSVLEGFGSSDDYIIGIVNRDVVEAP